MENTSQQWGLLMETPSKKTLLFGLYDKYVATQPVLIVSYESYTSTNKKVANYGYVGFNKNGKFVQWGAIVDAAKKFGVTLDNLQRITIV